MATSAPVTPADSERLWHDLCARRPVVYFSRAANRYLNDAMDQTVRMLQWCGLRVRSWDGDTVVGPEEYVVVEYLAFFGPQAMAYPTRAGPHQLLIQSEPLAYCQWIGRSSPESKAKLAMVFEYTPGHVPAWLGAGVPCLFYPVTWCTPLVAPKAFAPAPEPITYNVTSLKFSRRQALFTALQDRGVSVVGGCFIQDALTAMLQGAPVGVQVRKEHFRGCVEVHRITLFAASWPSLAWVTEAGMDDEVWSAALPHVVFCAAHGNDAVLAAVTELAAQPDRVQALVAAGHAAACAWYNDWVVGGLGFPKALYDALPWLAPYVPEEYKRARDARAAP